MYNVFVCVYVYDDVVCRYVLYVGIVLYELDGLMWVGNTINWLASSSMHGGGAAAENNGNYMYLWQVTCP